MKFTNQIRPLFFWIWQHLAEIGVITAILFSLNQMKQSEIQFAANSNSSKQLVAEIQRLETINAKQATNDSLKAIYDSIASVKLINQIRELQLINERQNTSYRKQAKLEYDAITELINQIGQLQEITASQLKTAKEQQKLAEQLARDNEEKERPKLLVNRYYTPGEQNLDNHDGYTGYRYVGFHLVLRNVGKRNAEQPVIIQYVLGNDTIVKFNEKAKEHWIESDQIYTHYSNGIFYPSQKSERIDSIIVCLKINYQDLGLNKTYYNQPVFYKYLRFDNGFRKVECEENDIKTINSGITHLETQQHYGYQTGK